MKCPKCGADHFDDTAIIEAHKPVVYVCRECKFVGNTISYTSSKTWQATWSHPVNVTEEDVERWKEKIRELGITNPFWGPWDEPGEKIKIQFDEMNDELAKKIDEIQRRNFYRGT